MRHPVTVVIPPRPEFVVALRTTIRGVAARDRFTIDQVDDLTMAVEEAAAHLLRHTEEAITLEVRTDLDELRLAVRAPVPADARVVDEGSFSWTILSALADGLEAGTDDSGQYAFRLVKRRFDAAPAQST